MKETLTRSLSGIVFIALILFSLIIHPLVYLVLFGIACALGGMELSRMFPDDIQPGFRFPLSALLAAGFIGVYFVAAGYLPPRWLALLVIVPLVPVLLRITIPGMRGNNTGLLVGGLIFLLVGFSGMHFLGFSVGSQEGYLPRWILFTFYLLWMDDTMAYVSGRLAGKHPVWPRVSPAKTWEGSIGGALFTLALAILFSRFYPELSPGEWLGFAGIVILFGSLGDFFESWLKRKAGVKDSGRIMPGHGGILDRFDSFLLSVPFVSIYLLLIL